MLTKDDLQEIKSIVEETVEQKLEPLIVITQGLQMSVKSLQGDMATVKQDVGTLTTVVGGLQVTVGGLQKDVRVVKREIVKTNKNLNFVVGYLDTDHMKLRRRVDIIEERVGIVS